MKRLEQRPAPSESRGQTKGIDRRNDLIIA